MSEQPKLIFKDASKKLVFENLQPSLKYVFSCFKPKLFLSQQILARNPFVIKLLILFLQ